MFSGEAYSKVDHLDDAEHWYMEALAAKPQHIPAHLTLAKLLYRRVSSSHFSNLYLLSQLRKVNPLHLA